VTRLEIAPRAETQIRRVAAWWRQNRRAAPELFSLELAHALEALVRVPGVGTVYAKRRGVNIRRVLLPRSRYHVYFSYDPETDVVAVRAVWHGSRGRGPDLSPSTLFVKLNDGWNAEPNAPDARATVEGRDVLLDFFLNPWQFPRFREEQRARLRFRSTWRYRLGSTNDEGWYRGQCRFSAIAPAWGEFYEVRGDVRLDECPNDWKVVGPIEGPPLRHFLFYLRDETFECDAVDYVLDLGPPVPLREHDVVRVVRLLSPTREAGGTAQVSRQPRVGDVGTIVHVLGPHSFIVECVDTQGLTAWIADFEAEELEHCPRK
jgi:plasmid stabilization system protein ParE